MMKTTRSMKNVWPIVVLVLLAGIMIYFYISLNRIEKKAMAIQSQSMSDAGRVSAIVNFFNANLDAQQ